jgi:hypothetical protein
MKPKPTREARASSERTAPPSKDIGQMREKKHNMSELAAVGAPFEHLTGRRGQPHAEPL